MYDYSEVVSKLTLLLEAGMTTRMAWHKIACDYRNKTNHGDLKRPVYEEICTTDYNIQAGISEIKAYEQFGKRCDTREYMKLATLLQTNIKKGTKELSNLLEKKPVTLLKKKEHGTGKGRRGNDKTAYADDAYAHNGNDDNYDTGNMVFSYVVSGQGIGNMW